jgi:Sugar-specific transcriptional regulator TrmB
MSDIRNDILLSLKQLGYNDAEARVYYELVRRGPLTHLKLARLTGLSRTRVYRIIETLSASGVVTKKTDDDGAAIIANGAESLELPLINEAEQLRGHRRAYEKMQPLLNELFDQGKPPLNFSLRTYDGVTGFKQMLWNEQKTVGELLVFGDGTLEDLVGSTHWAEQQRAMTVEKGYTIREIANEPTVPTKNRAFTEAISTRRIDASILPLKHQIIIYNDTVSIYCWRDGQKTGLEIINRPYAQTMRAMFERYWGLSQK